MAHLFADRVEEKWDMLRSARAGSAAVSLPVAEADAQVELPEAPRDRTGGPPSMTEAHGVDITVGFLLLPCDQAMPREEWLEPG
jgi:hypothetical protein